eukprot:14201458-Alexandrium_andersonii.AAC.1
MCIRDRCLRAPRRATPRTRCGAQAPRGPPGDRERHRPVQGSAARALAAGQNSLGEASTHAEQRARQRGREEQEE